MSRFTRKDIEMVLRIQKDKFKEMGDISPGVLLVDDNDNYHFMSFTGVDQSCEYDYSYVINDMLMPGIQQFGPKAVTNYYVVFSNIRSKYNKDAFAYFPKLYIIHGTEKHDTIKEYALPSFKLLKSTRVKGRTEETIELSKHLIPEHGAFTRNMLGMKKTFSSSMFNA